MGRALELLKRIAGKRQVLLFSCQRRESEYLSGEDAVSVREL